MRFGGAAGELRRRCVREVGAVALAGVDDEHPGGAGGGDGGGAGRDGALQQRDVVAERLAEAAGLEKVALHVDDDERGRGRVKADGGRLGG